MGRGKIRKFHIVWSTVVSLLLTLFGMFLMIYPLIHCLFPDDDYGPCQPLEFWEKGVTFASGFLLYVVAIKMLLFFRRPYLEKGQLHFS